MRCWRSRAASGRVQGRIGELVALLGSSRCSEGRAGANIPVVAKIPVCGGPAEGGESSFHRVLERSFRTSQRCLFIIMSFFLNPLLLQLLNHSSSTDGGDEPLSHLDFKLSNLALTSDCPSIGFRKF